MSAIDITALEREFSDFLESSANDQKYIQQLRQTITDGKFRLIINVNDLRNHNSQLLARVMKNPRESIVALQQASKHTAENDHSLAKLLKTNELQVGFEGSFGLNSVSPRGLLSSLLNNLVEVEGIVTKCSSVRPKLVRSIHYCPATGKYMAPKEYRDATSMDIGIEVGGQLRLPTPSVVPTKDVEGNPIETEAGLCLYKDYQTVVLQEMPERARVGQLPRSIELILENDLVDRVKPGDRIRCVGVYRPLASVQNGMSFGLFDSRLVCNNIAVIGKEVGAVRLTGADVANIRTISSIPNILDLMAASLCPSIYGHEHVKKALVLQLLGGCERNLENGTHLRGDINVMMVGDPSTAKSQLLRAVLDIAPLAISTTGRGSSGVGLTAAVTSDSETGERRLEAGAMVLADRGIVCVDEFDKMGEGDRVAIHEVMEQQTVTIAKAGIHASLNARCSVLAAANPVYGQYDRTKRPQDNIGLPDSLLSRFDLLFIVLDQLDPNLDRRLSQHVIKSHQYRRPGTIMEPEPLNAASTVCLDDAADLEKDTPVWIRGGKTVTGASSSASSSSSSSSGAMDSKSANSSSAGDVLTKEFLRKYIHFAKNKISPTLTDAAMEIISTAYADMRSKQSQNNLPVTARTLETLIRLASASAKTRLSSLVEIEDVDLAKDLLDFVLYHEIGSGNNKRSSSDKTQSKNNEFEDDSTGDDDGDDDDDNGRGSRKRAVSASARVQQAKDSGKSKGITTDDVDDDLEEDVFGEESGPQSQADNVSVALAVDRGSERYKLVMTAIAKMSEVTKKEEFQLVDIGKRVNEAIRMRSFSSSSSSTSSSASYTRKELMAILCELEKENKIMIDDSTIYIV